MNTVMFKKYIPATGKGVNSIKITLDYELGGYNMWNGHEDQRGYYLYVAPVERTERPGGYICESTILGAGIKECIVPVQRQSKKAAEKAIQLIDSRVENLINYVCHNYGVEVLAND